MKKIIFFFVVVAMLAGCETLGFKQSAKPKPGTCIPQLENWLCNQYVVEFVSEPPGAKIEVDGSYLGETPVTQTMNGEVYINTLVTIVAYPTRVGDFAQRKFLFNGQMFPHKIYFDMTLGPQTPSIDANVNQK